MGLGGLVQTILPGVLQGPNGNGNVSSGGFPVSSPVEDGVVSGEETAHLICKWLKHFKRAADKGLVKAPGCVWVQH